VKTNKKPAFRRVFYSTWDVSADAPSLHPPLCTGITVLKPEKVEVRFSPWKAALPKRWASGKGGSVPVIVAE